MALRTVTTCGAVPDAQYSAPRLAAVYDALDPDRSDLVLYAQMAEKLGAVRVLDIGCGTGTLACMLARNGRSVVGLDPAAASLDVASGKPGATRVRWICGSAVDLPALQVDLVTMTGNVAQVFVTDGQWAEVLDAAHRSLRPGGHLVFETRRPEDEAWRRWTPAATRACARETGGGEVTSWVEVTAVRGPLVSFRTTFQFGADGAVMTSESTLRFRTLEELAASLAAAGFELQEVRDAPDRPGRELIVIARRAGAG